MSVLVPYHQDEYLPGLANALPPGWAEVVVTADLPAERAGWERLTPIFRAVSAAVAGSADVPAVISGCCCVSLGVLAGLQRAGVDAGVVWFDAHGDLQTMETTASGYLGGMPLRVMAGYRPELVADAIGMRPVPEDRVLLVDARDLDVPEEQYLRAAATRRSTVEEVSADTLPPGPLLLHVDLDVVDPAELPGLRFPVPGGPSAAAVVQAVRRILATGQVAALDVASTWDPSTADPAGSRAAILTALLDAGAAR